LFIALGVGKYIVNIEEILDAQYASTVDREYRIIGFLDSDPDKHCKEFCGFPVLGDLNWLREQEEEINAISFINPTGRAELMNSILDFKKVIFPNLIHPSAIISPKAKFGKGNIFAQNVIIAPYVTIGDFNHFNYCVSIGHHCRVSSFVTCNGGAHIAGSSTIEEMVFIGPGAVVVDEINIGARAKVGANAVVRKDVPPECLAVGVPARIIGPQ